LLVIHELSLLLLTWQKSSSSLAISLTLFSCDNETTGGTVVESVHHVELGH